MSTTELLVTTIVVGYRSVHQQLREALSGLAPEALAWTPGPDTSSIGTLCVHLLGSEGEALRSVRGMPSDRDRGAEFAARSYSRDELLALIDAADRELDSLGLALTKKDLRAVRARPNHAESETGMHWLVRNYGHAREHLAHVELTRQLYAFAHREGAPDDR
jgi:hypothetical protein